MATLQQQKYLTSLLVIFFLLASWVCFNHQPLGCRYCDTRGYLAMGTAYAEAGGISEVIMMNEQTGEPFEASKLRLYGYPLFIAGLVKTAGIADIDSSLVVFGAQLAIYLAAALWLAAILRRHAPPPLAGITLAGLLLNPFVYPYFGTPLSDSLSLGLVLILFSLLATLFYLPAVPRLLARALGLGLLIGLFLGFLLMVRPGNMYLVAFGALAVPGLALMRRRALLLVALPAAILGFAAAVAPQLAFNWQHYQQFTFMPVSELGKFQLGAGRTLLKYATWTKAGGQGINYPSPWAGLPSAEGAAWYLHHGMAAAKTIAMHVFGMLDFEYYTPYVDKVKPRHEFLLLLLSQGLVFWAIVGWVRAGLTWRAQGMQRGPLSIMLGLAALFALSWLGVYALTAGENRFAMPLMVLAGPFACWALSRRLDRTQREIIAGFAVYLALAHHAAFLLDGLRSTVAG